MRLEPVAHVGGADEAGAAGDQDRSRRGPRSPASARYSAEALRASRAARSASGRSLPSTEYAGRGAGRAEHLGGRRHHAASPRRPGRRSPARTRTTSTRPPPAMWWMPKSSPSISCASASARCARVGGAADLVGDDEHLGLLAAEPQHRLDEVRAAEAEQPGGADDEVARVGDRDRGLARLLRAAVGRDRRGQVGLDVGRAACAVEDVVAREVERPWRRRWPRPPRAAPRPSSLTRIASRSLASAPSTSVQAAQLTTASGRGLGDRVPRPRRGSVMSRSARASADDLVAARARAPRSTSLPSIPPAPVTRTLTGSLISALSPTIIRSVFGIPSLRASFTLRPSRLASIRASRSRDARARRAGSSARPRSRRSRRRGRSTCTGRCRSR